MLTVGNAICRVVQRYSMGPARWDGRHSSDTLDATVSGQYFFSHEDMVHPYTPERKMCPEVNLDNLGLSVNHKRVYSF